MKEKTIYKVVRYAEAKEDMIKVTVLAGAHYMDIIGGMVSVYIDAKRSNFKAVIVNPEEMTENGFSTPWAASISFPAHHNGKEWMLPWVLVIDEKHPWVCERDAKFHIDVYIDVDSILNVFEKGFSKEEIENE